MTTAQKDNAESVMPAGPFNSMEETSESIVSAIRE